MRRILVLISILSALAGAASSPASLTPLRRHFGDVTIPRFRHGTIALPAAATRGAARVVVTIAQPPLAQAYGDGLGYRLGRRQLDVATRSSEAYLAKINAAQARAIAQLRRAIPEARISWRYRIVLDGFAVSLPATKLPRLLQLGFLRHVYPSLRYTLSLNKSPSLIGATQLAAATGADGAGIKIGIVDDGIDQTNQFFNPSGFAYPAGFPKGNTSFTTAKVILARAFPGPGSGRRPACRSTGRRPSTARMSPGSPPATRARRRRPDATIPSSPGCPASRRAPGSATIASSTSRRRSGTIAEHPEIVAAFESGRRGRHGRDQLLGRRAGDGPGQRRDDRHDQTTSPPPASCP